MSKPDAVFFGLVLGWAMMALFITGAPERCVNYPFEGPGAGVYYQPGEIAATYCRRDWLP